MENKELREMYEDFCNLNNRTIEDKNRKGIMPVCVIIEENGKESIIGFQFSNYEEKRMAREFLFKTLLEKKIAGYILIQDAKMTMMDKKTGKTEVSDVVMRSLFSKNNLKIKEVVTYDDKQRKIIKTMKLLDSEKKDGDVEKVVDEWDLYGEWFDEENPEHRKIQEDYSKYKKGHKEEYGGI